MLIALDVGNTAVTAAVFTRNGQPKQLKTFTHIEIPKLITFCSKSGRRGQISFIISSVVPKITAKLKKRLAPKGRVWVVGQNVIAPIRHRYRHFEKLGADRIVNIYGALRLHGGPCLVLDFGTAITADLISAKGVFEGGLIIPGPELSFQALIRKAALLPKDARLPKNAPAFLGRETYECMRSGIIQGFSSLTDGLIRRFKSKYGKNLKVVATGGFAVHLKPYSRELKTVDPGLTVRSLYLVYRDICS
jgi:type III pantothenate kinase